MVKEEAVEKKMVKAEAEETAKEVVAEEMAKEVAADKDKGRENLALECLAAAATGTSTTVLTPTAVAAAQNEPHRGENNAANCKRRRNY